MASYILTPEGEADLDEIWLFIANKSGSIDMADRFLDTLTERLQLIADHPYLGRAHEVLKSARRFVAGDYLIFYRIVDDDDVIVLRVLHGRRDVDALLAPPG